MSRWRSAAAIALLMASPEPPLAADDDTTKALLACAAETDDARRLSCYDATVDRLSEKPASRAAPATSTAAAASASTAAAGPPAATPAAVNRAAATTAAATMAAGTPAATPAAAGATPASTAPAAGASATTVPAASAPPAPSSKLSPEEEFGKRRDHEEEKKGQLTELSASVTSLSSKPHGEMVITLDNGQVWAEIAPGSKIRLKPGDPVKIEAGTFGSFILIAPNKRSSKVTRVR